MISDDQAYCDYGFMNVCRSTDSGTPLPAPSTPDLDELAKAGRLFPRAHGGAAICEPTLQTILTGKLLPQPSPCAGDGLCDQGTCRGGTRDGAPCSINQPPGSRSAADKPGTAWAPTIPQFLRRFGYCSFESGKLYMPGGAQLGFDAISPNPSLGRVKCQRCGYDTFKALAANDPACTAPPTCGEDIKGEDVAGSGHLKPFLDDLVTDADRLGQPFFLWYGPHVPHPDPNPSEMVEVVMPIADSSGKPVAGHPPADWLFGNQARQPFNFPFGDPRYRGLKLANSDGTYDLFKEAFMLGRYGAVWYADNALGRLRRLLKKKHVLPRCRPRDGTGRGPCDETHPCVCSDAPARACTTARDCAAHCGSDQACSNAPGLTCAGDDDCNSLAANTVIIFLSDNGNYLPHSKDAFTENGYRTPLILYDPRQPPKPFPANQIEHELVHGTDILRTFLSYAGRSAAHDGPDGRPIGYLGVDLSAYSSGAGSRPPYRNVLCGPEQRDTSATRNRYAVTRAGLVGRCTIDGKPTLDICLGDGDCPKPAPRGDEPPPPVACADKDVKWCRLGGRCSGSGAPCATDVDCPKFKNANSLCLANDALGSCASDPDTPACTVDSDCTTPPCVLRPVPCPHGDGDCREVCPSKFDSTACTCESLVVKLYATSTKSLTNLLTDPDEKTLTLKAPSTKWSCTPDALAKAPSSAKVGCHLSCALDRWWKPTAGSDDCRTDSDIDRALACNGGEVGSGRNPLPGPKPQSRTRR